MCRNGVNDLAHSYAPLNQSGRFPGALTIQLGKSTGFGSSLLTREMRECVNLFPHGCGGVFSFSALGEEKMMMPCNHFKIIPFAHTKRFFLNPAQDLFFILDLFSFDPFRSTVVFLGGGFPPAKQTEDARKERNKTQNTKIN